MTDTALEVFHQQLDQWVEDGALPGAHCLIREQGETLGDKIVGFADVEEQSPLHQHSLFRLASATKVFTSVGFLILIENGRLKLTDPVSKILPEFTHLQYFDSMGAIQSATRVMTMEDLLRHSCGYGYGDQGPYRDALMAAGLLGTDEAGVDHWIHSYSLRDWATALSKVPMEAEPGTAVSYGLGHDLLGAVIEVVTGQSLDAFMQQHLFTPLGLLDTFFIVPADRVKDLTSYYTVKNDQLLRIETAGESDFTRRPNSFSGGGGWDMLGNGGLVTSAQDFATLLELILCDGTLAGRKILSPALAAKLKTGASYGLASSEMLPGCSYSYGMSCVDDIEKYSGAGPVGKMSWGGSTNTFYYYLPNKNQLGVFLTHTFPFAHLNAIYRFSGLSATIQT